VIRDATPADLPAITALYGREVTDGTATFELEPPALETMAARFEAVRAHGLPWLTAETPAGFAGYAYASPFRPRAAYRYGVEVSIYVEAAARGQGVGRALLAALVARVRGLGLRHLIAAISDSDTRDASIALHAREGFQPAGRYTAVGWKHGRWLDVHLLQLDLWPEGPPPPGPGLDLG
jgi:L-amino acid N-acyltransferase YncA